LLLYKLPLSAAFLGDGDQPLIVTGDLSIKDFPYGEG